MEQRRHWRKGGARGGDKGYCILALTAHLNIALLRLPGLLGQLAIDERGGERGRSSKRKTLRDNITHEPPEFSLPMTLDGLRAAAATI